MFQDGADILKRTKKSCVIVHFCYVNNTILMRLYVFVVDDV
jgi:hypothetical protein